MFKIFTGWDHFNGYPLFQVTGEDYVGEWHTDRSDAETELNTLTPA